MACLAAVQTPRRLTNQAPCAKPHDGGAERRALSERKRMNLRRLYQRLLCRKRLREVTGAQLFFLDARELSWAATFFPASVRSACSAVEMVASPALSVLAVSCASSSSGDRLSITNSAQLGVASVVVELVPGLARQLCWSCGPQ